MIDKLAPRYLPVGECALTVEFGATIDPSIHAEVLALDAALKNKPIEGLCETAPTYRSLTIHFDPRRLTTEALIEWLTNLSDSTSTGEAGRRTCFWSIPTCYEPPHCEDLDELSTALQMPQERIIRLHQEARYRVYMYGFAPGYVFLGGLPQELALPRRPQPRPPIPPGALLIAAGQALIAGGAMPTGWYMVGRTPVKLFDPKREAPFFVAAGDELRFEAIDGVRFAALSRAAEAGEIIVHCEP
ncbi:MAG TPA: allophanate hydrolase subunit 1 [Methylocella sp.]|nr:allophanate hydrolase subunit 1 [Methylocella sp.]